MPCTTPADSIATATAGQASAGRSWIADIDPAVLLRRRPYRHRRLAISPAGIPERDQHHGDSTSRLAFPLEHLTRAASAQPTNAPGNGFGQGLSTCRIRAPPQWADVQFWRRQVPGAPARVPAAQHSLPVLGDAARTRLAGQEVCRLALSSTSARGGISLLNLSRSGQTAAATASSTGAGASPQFRRPSAQPRTEPRRMVRPSVDQIFSSSGLKVMVDAAQALVELVDAGGVLRRPEPGPSRHICYIHAP